ncbi:hypothetical protein OCU04_009411 [Sclerotinia nivalis]|uniref:Uncharacterized protein n=1 Tax=Sclerotinia nivalis TaxID=352851 RepID=A0A9X0DGI3_9HELO|nr:hypothetical protein OCU04_009411 [Sclerotinia nivalis]
MLNRQIVAVAIALLVQVSIVLSNIAENDFMKNGIQERTQEQGQSTQGRERQAQGRGIQSRQFWNQTQQMQSQQSQSESSRTLLSQSLRTGQGQQPQSPNAGGSGQCFLPNGYVDFNGIPCLSGDNTSRCCGSDEFCSTNKLCVSKNNANKFSRGSCADPTFSAASCPSFCQGANDNGSVLPCGEPSLGQFCCDEGQGFACCSTPSKVFSVGRGTNFTEKYLNSSVTSSSISNFKPQRSSMLTILTNTDTATQTQTQIQISSATQTIVSTSVFVSVQIVTSIQTPTPTILFPPIASTTVPTSIIFATQTTISQSQPSLSLKATPSASVFLNENSQPLPSSTLTNSDTQASTASSSPNGNRNQNEQAGASTTSSQNSSGPSNLSLADNLDIQSTLANLLKSPNMTAIIVGAGGLLLIVILIVALCCFRKRRRGKKSRDKSKDVIRRGSESQRGASEGRKKKDGEESGDPNIKVFVTVFEKSKGRKGKAQAAYVDEDDRISRELDGALGGGSYLEGGTMGREIKPANFGRRPLGRENIDFQNPMGYRDRSPNPFIPLPGPSEFRSPTIPILPPLESPDSDYFNSPTIPILPPPTPIPLSPQPRDSNYRISRASFLSVTSGSRYSRMTTGEPFQIPLAMDAPVPYRPVGSESRGVGAYGMVSPEGERGFGLGRVDEQRQELPRGFF